MAHLLRTQPREEAMLWAQRALERAEQDKAAKTLRKRRLLKRTAVIRQLLAQRAREVGNLERELIELNRQMEDLR